MLQVDIVPQLAPAHLAQLPELLERAALVDGHEPIGEHKFLRMRQGDDLALALVACEGDKLLGYGQTLVYGQGGERRVSCEFVVHPDARVRGVGAQLVDRAIEHSAAQGAGRIDVWSYNDRASGAGPLSDAGFAVSRRLLHLHRHVRDPLKAPTRPDLRVRPFVAGREEALLLQLNGRIFAHHPEQGGWTLDDLRARMSQPWFDANDVLILESEGVPIGFCWLKVQERGVEGLVGEVYVIGAVPEARGTGAGAYLLARAMEQLAARKVRVAAIYVDESNERALRLYQSSGFHYHHVDVCYSLAIAGERPNGARAEAAA